MDPLGASLKSLEHRPSRKVSWKHWRFKLPGVLLELAGLVIVIVVFGPTLMEAPLLTVEWFLRALFLGLLLALILFILFLEGLQGLVRISGGKMFVPFPVQGRNGSPTHSIPLSDIKDVAPQFDGLDMYLRKGQRVFLPRSAFGSGGVETIERLSNAFGKSFRERVETDIGQGFTVFIAKPKRLRGDTVILDRPIQCYSDQTRWKLLPTDVRSVTALDTVHSGPVWRVDLLDGTPLLLPYEDLERIGMSGSPRWTAKIRPAT